ncbi:MAG: AraC family transcriptional regulator [Muribaculaceae bacterium]|nr:AraC family transcriptional regulator [Muribaculaceae bacterium]
MYQIKDFYSNFLKRNLNNFPGIVAEKINFNDAAWLEDYKETFSFYAFTFVITGKIKINYDGETLELGRNSFHLYLPGSEFSVVEVSNDYMAICIIADESYILDLPCMEKLLVITYSPNLLKSKGHIKLNEKPSRRINCLFSLIEDYTQSLNKYKGECINDIFSALIYDFSNILEINNNNRIVTENLEWIFLKFFQLLKENFLSQHEIRHYSDKLGITPEYLSRIVKKISGKTVIHFLNRMLVTEASRQLLHSDMSMEELSEHLNFASSASLSKFFKKHKGISPLKYRQTHIYK